MISLLSLSIFLKYSPEDKVDAKEDLFAGVYYAADVYTLTARSVRDKEKRMLENRMKWVLTGEDEHWKDSEAIGTEAAATKKIQDAQKRLEGTTRIKKRKGKRSNFYKRPNRWSALKNSTSVMEIDSNHNSDESFNYADDEGEDQDVDMEGEDADGKV